MIINPEYNKRMNLILFLGLINGLVLVFNSLPEQKLFKYLILF